MGLSHGEHRLFMHYLSDMSRPCSCVSNPRTLWWFPAGSRSRHRYPLEWVTPETLIRSLGTAMGPRPLEGPAAAQYVLGQSCF